MSPERDFGNRAGGRHEPDRIPPRREHGPEGRARSAHRQEGNGRGEPEHRDLDSQEIYEPRPAVPRPNSGRQYRPDRKSVEKGKSVSVSEERGGRRRLTKNIEKNNKENIYQRSMKTKY